LIVVAPKKVQRPNADLGLDVMPVLHPGQPAVHGSGPCRHHTVDHEMRLQNCVDYILVRIGLIEHFDPAEANNVIHETSVFNLLRLGPMNCPRLFQ
jgi:hypothetical protein